MKILFTIFLLLTITIGTSCQGNKQKFQPMAEKIKKSVLQEFKNIKKIDTIYLLIKIMTKKEKVIIQAVEYEYAATEAKNNGNADSSYYEFTANRLLAQAGKLDTTKFLYYIAAANVIFTYNNLEKGTIEKRMFFDEDLNVVQKYSIIQKISITDNLKTQPQPYEPFTPEDYKYLDSIRVLKYY